MTPQRLPHSRRALATVFSLTILGLVAATLTASAMLLGNDIRRTRQLQSDAQLRQLLLAAATTAVSDVKGWSDGNAGKTWSMTLPTDPRLQSATITIHFAPAPSGMLNLHITAALDNRQAAEDLRFHHSADHWELTDIQLGPVSNVPSKPSP
jgi:type II secretory pathway pseudopilin PulG